MAQPQHLLFHELEIDRIQLISDLDYALSRASATSVPETHSHAVARHSIWLMNRDSSGILDGRVSLSETIRTIKRR